MDAKTSKLMNDMVNDFRKQVRDKCSEAPREMLMEFAACIIEQELQESSADEDIRAGSLIFVKHRILRHGGDLLSCSRCVG